MEEMKRQQEIGYRLKQLASKVYKFFSTEQHTQQPQHSKTKAPISVDLLLNTEQ